MTGENGGFMATVRRWFHEGNVRHVLVTKADHRAVDLPLTIVLLIALLAPWIAAIGLVAALVLGYELKVVNLAEAGAPGDATSQSEAMAGEATAPPDTVPTPGPGTPAEGAPGDLDGRPCSQ